MIHLKGNFPNKWIELLEGRIFAQADCSKWLIEIAESVFMQTIELDNKLVVT